MLLGMEVGLDPGHIVLDGNPAPPKRGTAPNFRPMSVWPNGWMDQDATWYGGKHRLRDIVLYGDLAPKKGGTAPPLLADVNCGQTAGCLKMRLGKEEGLGQATLC